MLLKTQQKYLIYINSVLLAFFVDIQCVNQYLITFSTRFESIMTYLYVGIILLITSSGLITKKERYKHYPVLYLMVLTYILSLYFITSLTNKVPYTSLTFFLVFTVIAYLIPSLIVIDSKIVIKAAMLIPVPSVFRINEIFMMNGIDTDTISMGQSYAFLVPIVASAIYLVLYFKDENFVQKSIGLLGCCVSLLFLLQLLLYGSRGPILSFTLLVILLLTVKLSHAGGERITFDRKRLAIFTICILLVILFFIPILTFLQSILLKQGISFNFINKIVYLIDNGDISNGRSDIFSVVSNAFLEKPLLGHGFDLFKEEGLYYYPHNFIYQTIYDGGLLMLLLVIVPSAFKIIYSVRRSQFETIVILLFLFFISVPGAMFSGDLWQQGNLWILTGMLLNNNKMIYVKTDLYESNLNS